jgi:hypothetical protein
MCDINGATQKDVRDHWQNHDLIERIEFTAPESFWRLSNYRGKATCPICALEVCGSYQLVTDLWRHLENEHAVNDLVENGEKIAKLLISSLDFIQSCKWPYQNVARVVRDFRPILQKLSLNPSKTIEDLLLISHFNEEINATVPSSDFFGVTPAHRDGFFPGIDMVEHDSSVKEAISMSSQNRVTQQNLPLQQSFMPAYALIPQLHAPLEYAPAQPQGLVGTQMFINNGVNQHDPMVPTMTPQFTVPGINLWQPITSGNVNIEFGEFSHDGQMQWPVQPGTVEYDAVNKQQNISPFVPFPQSVDLFAPLPQTMDSFVPFSVEMDSIAPFPEILDASVPFMESMSYLAGVAQDDQSGESSNTGNV